MPHTTKRPPNILFIMADQHRWDYLGCMGADFVRTPNLDRLAARGTRFTHCCTNAPVCAPARIALATGLQAHATGALGNADFLPAGATTYYQRLRDAHYRTGCVGKLDLAKPDKYNGRHGDRPRVFGFGFTHPEECEGKMHAGQYDRPQGPYGFHLESKGLYRAFREDYRKRNAEGYALSCHDSVLPAEDFEDAYIGRRATEWIERIPGDFPWHYFVSFVGPHDPFDPPAEYAQRYREAAMPAAIADDPLRMPDAIRKKSHAASPQKVLETRRQYCAAIEAIDDYVGWILGALEKRGWLDDTYVFFSSDHGEMLGDHTLYTKSVPYEAALRVPLLAAGPGIPAGRENDALVELIDLNPTICELAGLPPQDGIHARSLAPLLRGETSAHREDILSQIKPFALLRTRRHKYVRYAGGEMELYDLAEDPNELRNIAADQADLAKQLGERLDLRLREGK